MIPVDSSEFSSFAVWTAKKHREIGGIAAISDLWFGLSIRTTLLIVWYILVYELKLLLQQWDEVSIFKCYWGTVVSHSSW